MRVNESIRVFTMLLYTLRRERWRSATVVSVYVFRERSQERDLFNLQDTKATRGVVSSSPEFTGNERTKEV